MTLKQVALLVTVNQFYSYSLEAVYMPEENSFHLKVFGKFPDQDFKYYYGSTPERLYDSIHKQEHVDPSVGVELPVNEPEFQLQDVAINNNVRSFSVDPLTGLEPDSPEPVPGGNT